MASLRSRIYGLVLLGIALSGRQVFAGAIANRVVTGSGSTSEGASFTWPATSVTSANASASISETDSDTQFHLVTNAIGSRVLVGASCSIRMTFTLADATPYTLQTSVFGLGNVFLDGVGAPQDTNAHLLQGTLLAGSHYVEVQNSTQGFVGGSQIFTTFNVPVPEPLSAAILGAGLLALLRRPRKRPLSE